MGIREILEENPIIPAIKDELTLKQAISSNSKIVFIIMSTILNIKSMCDELKQAGKIVFIHIDMIDGLNSSNNSIDYIVDIVKPDGLLTTKSNVVSYAFKKHIKVIQRFFVLDSLSYEKALQSIKENKTIAVEIMPGLMPKIISKLKKEINQPIITGGLIDTKTDIINALNAGASSVSTTKIEIWNI